MIRFFRSVRFPGDWELNFVTKIWNLRIGRSQFALWHKLSPVFNFLRQS